MRGEHDRRAAGGQPAHVRPQVAAQLDVHARGGLVEEQDRRAVDQRFGDEQPALHAAR